MPSECAASSELPFFTPDAPFPANVRALQTTRQGGVSHAPFASFNLATHVGDDPARVAKNRVRLRAQLPEMPRWLTQTHSATVVIADSQPFLTPPEADAIVSHQRSAVCAVMTADCLPVLLCNRAGTVVAAAHAGWRGLAAGVLKNTVAAMAVPPADILAWLGPAISGQAFEVGEEVKQAFVTHANPGMEADAAFQPLPFPMGKMLRPKWSPTYLADLYRLARLHLAHCGVHACYGGNFCTFTETDRFFSYRRDATTGRMASLIYLL